MGDNSGQGGSSGGGGDQGGTIPFAAPIPSNKSSIVTTAIAAFAGGLLGALVGLNIG